MSTATKSRWPVGVVLMTYGSATTAADVPAFLTDVYGDHPVSDEVIGEFKRRFELIGSSPLIEITIGQARALQAELGRRFGDDRYLVEAGMLHSAPTIAAAVERLAAAGCVRIVGLLLSPQYSAIIMGGYERALKAAANESGLPFEILEPWPAQPKFVELTARRLTEARTELAGRHGQNVPIIFTTHSLPESVVKRDPSYLTQLQSTIDAVAAAANLKPGDWTAAYQSAGHTPEKWLEPDLQDVVTTFAKRGIRGVVIVPIQFLADHLEVLYDLDVAAREQVESLGIEYRRTTMPNTDPLFIAALAEVVASSSEYSAPKK